MTKSRDPEALLSAYLAVGMDALPDRVVDSVLGEVHRTRQRRAGFGPWRPRPMFRSALGAATVVAVLVVGGSFFVFGPPNVTPSADPSASLPGIVAPSSRPSATAPNLSGFPRTTGVWIPTGTMGTPRSGHDAVRLLDGRVLVMGGHPGDEPDLTAELYDPETGTWSATGNMLRPHDGFSPTLLRDGRVLVGVVDDPAADNPVEGADLYDPETGTWTAAREMIQHRGCCDTGTATATLLRDGRVLVAGTDGSQLYDPENGTWTATGKMTRRHQHTAVLLSDGKVLVAGGFVTDQSGVHLPEIQRSAELYDPATGTWTAIADMNAERPTYITATLLPDGRVLVMGAGNRTSPDLYDPAAGTWTATGTNHNGSATLLLDGTVLVGGTVLMGRVLVPDELYDPGTGSWTTTGSTLRDHVSSPYTPLLDGTVLVVGGRDCSGLAVKNLTDLNLTDCIATGSAELYVPAGVTPPSWLPTSPPPAQAPVPTPTPVPTAAPTPFPPAPGPVPQGARSWAVTVVNGSSQLATLFVAEELELGVMGRLVGSVTPNVVPPATTVEVTFLLPAKRVEGWGIFVTPIPGISAFLWGTDVPLAGEIRIGPDGEAGWLSP